MCVPRERILAFSPQGFPEGPPDPCCIESELLSLSFLPFLGLLPPSLVVEIVSGGGVILFGFKG